MRKVAILAHSHVTLFEMSCAIELFALPRPEFDNWYQADVVNLEGNDIHTTGNLIVKAQHCNTLEPYDTLVVPGWPTWDYPIPQTIEQQVHQFIKEGKRVLTLCSGSFLLGKLGLLDGKTATTHWMYEQTFRRQFPLVHYQPDVLYVFDGNIGCSAGSAAALDLGLAVIREDFGYNIANQVAKRLVISAHRLGYTDSEDRHSLSRHRYWKCQTSFPLPSTGPIANSTKALPLIPWLKKPICRAVPLTGNFAPALIFHPKSG